MARLTEKQIATLYRNLARCRNTNTYGNVARYIDYVDCKTTIQFWRDYAEQQEDSPSKTNILERYNLIFHGCANVGQAWILTDLEHIEWWHSQYPDAGLERRISFFKYGAETVVQALERKEDLTDKQLEHWHRVSKIPEFGDLLFIRQHGALTEEEALCKTDMSEEHLEYWLQETGNPLFIDKLFLAQAPTTGLSELEFDTLSDLFYIAIELGHPPGKNPFRFLATICRRPIQADKTTKVVDMMKKYGTEALWEAMFNDSVDGPPFTIDAFKCLTRLHPVHQKAFW